MEPGSSDTCWVTVPAVLCSAVRLHQYPMIQSTGKLIIIAVFKVNCAGFSYAGGLNCRWDGLGGVHAYLEMEQVPVSECTAGSNL